MIADLKPYPAMKDSGVEWLTHHVHIIEMNGESLRLKQGKTKNRS